MPDPDKLHTKSSYLNVYSTKNQQERRYPIEKLTKTNKLTGTLQNKDNQLANKIVKQS